MPVQKETSLFCPCGTGQRYLDCCAAYHQAQSVPETAEQLMRSRYSAYVLQQIDYLLDTTHPQSRKKLARRELADWARQVEFLQLEVVNTLQGGAADKVGKVEFIVYFNHLGERSRLHEISRFKRFRSCWMYLDGTFVEED